MECNYEEEILLLLDKVKSDRILEIIYHFLDGAHTPQTGHHRSQSARLPAGRRPFGRVA